MGKLNAWTSVLMLDDGERKGTAGVVQGPAEGDGMVMVKWDTDQVIEAVNMESLRAIG